MSTPKRLDHLRAYFLQLGADVSAHGAFQAAGANRIEAAAAAVLAGGSAMAEQFFADVKALAGEGAQLARPIAEGILTGELERGARKVAARVIDAVASRFDGRAAQRDAAKKDVAKKLMELGKPRR